MDIRTKSTDENSWSLYDLLGRWLGQIKEELNGYRIEIAGPINPLLDGVVAGPSASLEEAMETVGKHARGACRFEV